jgi:hypothetical protein
VLTLAAQPVPPPAEAVIFDGQEIVGLILSITTTLKVHDVILPAASSTLYVTTVVPALNVYVPMVLIPVEGDTAIVAPVMVHVSFVIAQLSLYVGFVVTTLAEHEPAATFALALEGQEMLGEILSVITTLKLHVEAFPAPSNAV